MYKRVIYGAVANDGVAGARPTSTAASSGCSPRWRLLVLWMGVWPKPFIDVMHASVADLLAHVARSKL